MPKIPYGWIVKQMCKGCLRISGHRCLIQTDPYYLWRKYGKCWSKITDPERVKEIENAIMEYCGVRNQKYIPLEPIFEEPSSFDDLLEDLREEYQRRQAW